MTDYPVKYGPRLGDGTRDYTFGANPDPGADSGASMSGLLECKMKKTWQMYPIITMDAFSCWVASLHLHFNCTFFNFTGYVESELVNISAVPVSLLVCISWYQEKVNSAQCHWCLESKQSVAATKVDINQVHWPQAWFNRQHLFLMCSSWFTDNCALGRTLSPSLHDSRPALTRTGGACTRRQTINPLFLLVFLKHNASTVLSELAACVCICFINCAAGFGAASACGRRGSLQTVRRLIPSKHSLH